MAVGLGGEQLWLSPTVANNVNPFDDQSGQGNNGTGKGGITTVADTGSGGSYAYYIDSFGQRVESSGVAGVIPTSISMWAKRSAWNRGSIYRTDTNSDISFEYNTVTYTAAGGSPQVATSLPAAAWFHLAVVSVGGTSEVYIDGVLTYTITTAAPYAITGYLSFGNYDYTHIPYIGDLYIDDCRLYDRSLTQSEITHLATSRGVLGPPGGATHYNPFKSHAFINDFQQRLR